MFYHILSTEILPCGLGDLNLIVYLNLLSHAIHVLRNLPLVSEARSCDGHSLTLPVLISWCFRAGRQGPRQSVGCLVSVSWRESNVWW